MQRLLAAAVAVTAACRLDPLVDDMPGASANILPGDAKIETADQNPDLLTQITLNDSLDSNALIASGNVIKRSRGGQSNGAEVSYWAFGEGERAPAPIYLFGTGDPTSPSSFKTNDHLPLVEAVPGDGEYEPVHTIYNVVVTDRYHGEKITTTGALADAIDLGFVEPPVATHVFVNWPIVRPGVQLEVGDGVTVAPRPIYGDGYIVDSFQLGGPLGLQPTPTGLLPTSQVSFLREQGQAAYDRARPIFQATIPTSQPGKSATYTPLSVVVNVDVAMGTASTFHGDGDLFMRSSTGEILSTKPNVLGFTVTETALDLQLQFQDGQP